MPRREPETDILKARILEILYDRWWNDNVIVGLQAEDMQETLNVEKNQVYKALLSLERDGYVENPPEYRITAPNGIKKHEETIPPSEHARKTMQRRSILKTLEAAYNDDVHMTISHDVLSDKTEIGHDELYRHMKYLQSEGYIYFEEANGGVFWTKLEAGGKSFCDKLAGDMETSCDRPGSGTEASLVMIDVRNFKSLKDFRMPLGRFNVLIGPNGSGKTNVLELFKFVCLCMAPQKTPQYPFAEWGGYGNLVWSGKTHEPIRWSISYTINGRNVAYESSITGSDNGRLTILDETLAIQDYLDLHLGRGKTRYSLDPFFAEWVGTRKKDLQMLEKTMPDLDNFELPHSNGDVSILYAPHWDRFVPDNAEVALLKTSSLTQDGIKTHVLPSPVVRQPKPRALYDLAAYYLTDPNNIVLLRHLDYNYMRTSASINYPDMLEEDGDGMVNLLFTWFNRDGKLPDIFTHALEALFPNWQISFQVTQESRIIMVVTDGTIRLAPASIPDGFYKLLAVLTAIELNPRILLIDEIETSLHARVIEYVVDLLKDVDFTVIITTHSPLVVDSVDAGDLVIMSSTGHESICRRLADPDALKKELADKGLLVSESWLYGDL